MLKDDKDDQIYETTHIKERQRRLGLSLRKKEKEGMFSTGLKIRDDDLAKVSRERFNFSFQG